MPYIDKLIYTVKKCDFYVPVSLLEKMNFLEIFANINFN